MLDCVAAVACVVMGLEAMEDRKATVRDGGDKTAEAVVECGIVRMLPNLGASA